MAGNDPYTQREALAVQMLEEIDILVRRLEEVGAGVREGCEQAILDASGKALLQTQMNFESVLERGQGDLMQAAKAASAKIGNELNRGSASVVLAADDLRRRVLMLAGIGIATALGAGLLGGFVGARLAMGM